MIEPLVLLLAALPTGLPTPAELQEEIVKARMAIRQGTITMRVEGRGVNVNDGTPENFDFENQFDFDGDRLRFDQVQSLVDGTLVGRWSIVHEPTSFIDFYDGVEEHEKPPRVRMGNREWMGGWQPIFHPRVIGLGTTNVNKMAQVTPEKYFRRNNTFEEVSEDLLDGVRVYRLAIDTGLVNDCRVEYWVDPLQAYALKRIEIWWKSASGDQVHGILHATYRQWPEDGTWFLSESTLHHERNSETTYTEIVRVNEARFGASPEATRFEISSMDIPVGTTVERNSQQLVWDGSALVSEVDELRSPSKTTSRWAWVHEPRVWIAGISGSLAILLALQYWHGRSDG